MIPTPTVRLREELADLRRQIANAVVGPPVWTRLIAGFLGACLGALAGFYTFLSRINWD
jgi:hypothetical protein